MLSETAAETLIREALNAQADRAPSASDVLAGLETARARRHTPGLGVVAAAIAVLIAVVIPVTLFDRETPEAALPSRAVLAIPYHPTWVPPGWTAHSRTLDDAGDQLPGFGWTPYGHPGNSLFLTIGHSRYPQAGPARQVTINGTTGFVTVGPTDTRNAFNGDPELETIVTWSPKLGTWLSIVMRYDLDATDTVLRMARSVVAEPVLTDVPYRIGYLPPNAVANAIEIDGESPHAWAAGAGTIGTAPGRIAVVVLWGPDVRPLLRNTRPTTVRGHTGYYSPDQNAIQVMQDGWWLRVSAANTTETQLLHVVNDMTFYPHADYSWLGR